MKRKMLTTIAVMMTALALTACGGGKNEETVTVSKNEQGESEKEQTKEQTEEMMTPEGVPFSMDDIAWEVVEENIDGQRVLSFNYTNNTSYVITDIEMQFKQREDVTPEQRAVFDDVKTEFEMTDEEVAEIYMLGYNRKFADPGETVSASPCSFNGTYTIMDNIEQYNLMEPDTASIAYIGNDDKIYMTYYDFKLQEFGSSTQDGKEMYQWSESEISSLLPKPDFKVVQVSNDSEEYFSFSVFGVVQDEYKTYLEECKTKGFSNVEYETETSYNATNEDGYTFSMSYNAIEETITGWVQKAA